MSFTSRIKDTSPPYLEDERIWQQFAATYSCLRPCAERCRAGP